MKGLEKWKQHAREIKAETYALYLAYRDPETPWAARLFAAVVVAYAFSPIDLIPDFVPLLGYLDDLVLVPLGIALALRMIPPAVRARSREQARALAAQGRPFGRAAAAVVVCTWLLLAAAGIALAVRTLAG